MTTLKELAESSYSLLRQRPDLADAQVWVLDDPCICIGLVGVHTNDNPIPDIDFPAGEVVAL